MNRNIQPNYSNRSSRQTSSQSLMSRPSRPPSESLCDLHVYKVPPDLWRGPFNNILNNAVTETISVGIIRVPAEIRLVDIREEIVQQLGANTDELLPKDYVFLRSVGRSLTTLRLKQEYQLKAKHFVPPVAYAPELFILEATPEIREALAVSDASSQSPPLSRQISPRSYPNTYRPGHGDNERPNKPYQRTTSPGNKYKPLPHIGSDPYREKNPNRVPDEYPYNRNSPSPTPHSNPQHPTNGIPDKYGPYHYNSKNHKNSPKTNKQHPETDSEQPGSEWDETPEDKKATSDRTPFYIKRTPPESAGKSKKRRQDDDSGVAGLSPDDDQHRRNRDDYDNILRKTKDLQKHLDSDKFSIDDETEEERRQRLEDLESRNFMDKQRWNDDQEERRRRAMEDRLREDERKREKDEEERRKKESEKRKQQEEEENRIRKENEKKRKEEEEKKKEEEEKKKENEQERKREEEKKKKQEDEERKRKELDKKEKDEAEKRKNEEKHRRDEEERKKKEAEEGKRKKEEQERKQEEEKFKKLKNRTPSPEEMIRDTESARQRRRDEKNQLLKDVDDAREARHNKEKVREELVRKAKQMQHKTTNRRNEARDMWKKKYFEEKKKTAPLEENSNRLQSELETLHKRLVNTLEGPKEKNMRLVEPRPSEKNNYVIQSTKLQHEIEDLQRRVEHARMKLTAEMKLRNQAQGELRALRAELTQRKQNIELNRQHQLASLNQYQKSGKENNSPSENAVTHPDHPKSYYGGL